MTIKLDALLGKVSFLAPLRPDELHRAMRRFKIVDLAPGETRALARGTPECAVVVGGRVVVETASIEGIPALEERLGRGDHIGVRALLSGRAFDGRIEALSAARLAILDAEAYRALEDEFPVIAVPACAALAQELAWKDDLLREVAQIRTENLAPDLRAVALEKRRRRVARRIAQRGSAAALYGAVLLELLKVWVREPAFWMLAGFLGAFGGARALVHWIFKHHAEEKLFNLHHVDGFKNPIHIHHFNYGLILVTITSLLAFFPAFRQHLRALGLVFGVGAGLIFDEFGLIWNLDPNYYQRLSWFAVALGALALAQLAFLRDTWTRRLRRLTHRERQ